MKPSSRWAYSMMAFGVVIRVWHLAAARSLYIDEARLALNIGTRGFADLTRPLDLEQLASVPFLWAVEASSRLLGMGEVALRAVPFLAGIALLPVLWALYRRVAGERVALLGLLLAAVAPALVRSSNDVKQYSLDALCAAVALWLTLMALENGRDLRAKLWLGVVMIICAIVSLPAPLYLVPFATSLAVTACRERRWSDAMLFTASLAVSLAVTFAGYQLLYRVGAGSEYMQAYWQGAFLEPWAPEFAGRWTFAVSDLTWGSLTGGFPILTSDSVSRVVRWVVASVAWLVPGWGAVILGRQRGARTALLMLGGTAGLLAAAICGVYPVGIRLWLFALPQWLLLGAIGVWALAQAASSRKIIRRSVVAAAALPGALVSIHPAHWPYIREDMRELANIVVAAPGSQTVYIFAGAAPAWTYYSTDWSNADRNRLLWYMSHIRYGGFAFENVRQWQSVESEALIWRGTDRVEILGVSTNQYWRPYFGLALEAPNPSWADYEARRIATVTTGEAWLLFSHYSGSENGLLDEFEQYGAVLHSLEQRVGAMLFKFDCSNLVAP